MAPCRRWIFPDSSPTFGTSRWTTCFCPRPPRSAACRRSSGWIRARPGALRMRRRSTRSSAGLRVTETRSQWPRSSQPRRVQPTWRFRPPRPSLGSLRSCRPRFATTATAHRRRCGERKRRLACCCATRAASTSRTTAPRGPSGSTPSPRRPPRNRPPRRRSSPPSRIRWPRLSRITWRRMRPSSRWRRAAWPGWASAWWAGLAARTRARGREAALCSTRTPPRRRVAGRGWDSGRTTWREPGARPGPESPGRPPPTRSPPTTREASPASTTASAVRKRPTPATRRRCVET